MLGMTARSDPRPEPVHIAAGGMRLEGDLVVPPRARGIVVFAHGSGSSRLSPRNRAVAHALQHAGLATLLMDLLSEHEEADEDAGAMRRFDVDFLARRLTSATDWLERAPKTRDLRIGYFGASTGAAAALIAAAARPDRIAAVVSRGGRPDLARPEVLARVKAPTLLIVGGRDVQVLEMNREAYGQLCCERNLAVVPGATHLFEELGALEEVAKHARDWFVRYLVPRSEAEHGVSS
jgi:putative phosphoribosyl transferase